VKDGRSTFGGLKDWVRRIFDSGGSVKVGAKVFHPSYGEGIIEQIQGSGATARVCVDFGFAKPIVSLSELTLDKDDSGADESVDSAAEEIAPPEISPVDASPVDATPFEDSPVKAPPIESSALEPQPLRPPQPSITQGKEPTTRLPSPEPEPKPKTASTKQMNEREVEARKGIMALRLGQILESQITDLSVGTAEIEQKFKQAISNTIADGPTFLLVDAAWGAGKTHALTMLQVLARNTMFATSYVVMDGISTSLALPMELMSELMAGLRFPDSTRATDLSHWLARAKQDERIEILEKRGMEYLSDTLRALPMEAFDDPEVLDLLSDFLALRLSATDANKQLREMNYGAKLKSVKARAVSDRIPRFVKLLEEWAVFASVMGYNGLLVVLDELDVEYAASAYGTQSDWKTIMRRRELLMELRNMIKTPLMIALAAAPGDPSLDEVYDPVRDIISCLGRKVQHIKVPTPNEKNLRLLLDRLLELYGEAYSVETAHLNQGASDLLFQELFDHYLRDPNAVTRRFVRSAIERMDLMFAQPTESGVDASSRLQY